LPLSVPMRTRRRGGTSSDARGLAHRKGQAGCGKLDCLRG